MSATKQPKIVSYMASLFDKMSTDSVALTAESGESLQIWQGRLIETCTSIGIPQGYYKKVVDALRGLGCVELVTRGTRGSTLTALILRYPPTAEMYDDAIVKSGWKGLTEAASVDTLAAQVRDLQSRLGGIDWLSMFRNNEERIKELETAVRDLQGQVSNINKSNTNK